MKKRPHAQLAGAGGAAAHTPSSPTPLTNSNAGQPHPLIQTSLKDMYRVTKPRLQPREGKENTVHTAGDAVQESSPPATKIKTAAPVLRPPPTLLRFGSSDRQAPTSIMTPTPQRTSAPAAAASDAPTPAPGLSDCGISFSTAPFAFPAPSEDTAAGGAGGVGGDITSCKLPGRLFLHHRMGAASPAHPAAAQQQQHQAAPSTTTATAADPGDEEVSCRHRPPPPSRRPTFSMSAPSTATFSSGGGGGGGGVAFAGPASRKGVAQHHNHNTNPQQQPEFSTASLASWLVAPGKGCCSSMQATGPAAGEESDCEDDAVSKAAVPPLPPAAAAAEAHTCSAGAVSGGSLVVTLPSGRQISPPPPCIAVAAGASDGSPPAAADSPARHTESVDVSPGGWGSGGVSSFLPMLLELAGGGGGLANTQQQVVPPGRVRYQTRLEELLFAMTYVAPPTPADTNSEGAEE